MRRTLFWLAALCFLAVASGCGDDDASTAGAETRGGKRPRGGKAGSGSTRDRDAGATGSQAVSIQFKAKLGDEDLECGRMYDGQGSSQLRATPQDFRFFVQELRLIAKNGDEVPVEFDDAPPFQSKQVALIDFTDGEGDCTVGGTTVHTTLRGKAPAGDYQGVVFVNGVPDAQNHEDLVLAKPPLQDASTHWGWISGYRFIMAVLIADRSQLPPTAADAGTPGELAGSNSVHVGSAGCSGGPATGFNCSRANRNRVQLDGFDPEKNTILADLSQVFAEVDLRDSLECHGPNPGCAPAYAALGVDLESGDALPEQRVFRVE